MIDPQYFDPVGFYVTELAEDATVSAIVGANPTSHPRVRSPEPGPGDQQSPRTASGGLGYRAFIVLVTLALPPHPQVPTQRTRHVVRCYGRTPEEAEELYNAATAVLHRAGPRQRASGKAIYVSHNDTGGTYEADPDTGQPCYYFVVEALATTQAVAQ